MSFTRKALKAMGLTDDQIESVVDMHTEVVDGLKAERDEYKAKAETLKDVEKERDELKANKGDDYKAKYDKEHNDFEAYKKSIADKETKAAKETAAKAYFEGKNITGANLEIALRGAKEEIGALELDGDKIKDTAALDALVNGTFAGLVTTTTTVGARTANPPQNTGGNPMSKAEIMAIKDDGERHKQIAKNHELFGF